MRASWLVGAAIGTAIAACGDDVAVHGDAAVTDAASVDGIEIDAPPVPPMPIANPSFELPAIDPGTFDVGGPPPGWTTFGTINGNERSVGVLDPATTTLYATAPPHGDNVAVVYLNDQTHAPAGIEQILAANVARKTTYILGVSVGNIANSAGHPTDFTGFPHYRIELLGGTEVLAADDNTLAPAEGTFARATVMVTIQDGDPRIGQHLGIRLVNLSAAAGVEVNFDDVTVYATPIE